MVSLRTLEKGLFLAAIALVACKKEETDTDSGGDDTADTDTSPIYLEANHMQMGFFFGYHLDAGASVDEFTSFEIDENLPDNITGTIADARATLYLFENLDDESGLICQIDVAQPGPIAPTSLGTGVNKGFKFNWSLATVTHDCDGLLDPAVWGDDMENLETVEWGVGIGGAVDGDVSADWLDAVGTAGAADWTGYMAGAHIFLSTTDAISGFYLARGSAVDTARNPPRLLWTDTDSDQIWDDTESEIFLAAADVGNGPVSGAYVVTSPYALSPQDGGSVASFFVATE